MGVDEVSYSTTATPYGATPAGEQSFYEDPSFWSSVSSWISGLFSSCAERNPSTWAEHYVTRCLRGQRWDGTPCPGTPDPRRAALAAQRDPAGASEIADQLRAWNEGWAPTPAEMAVPENAVLWTFAVAGGIDCRNSRAPSYPEEVWAWVRSQTPGWSLPSGPPPTPPPSGAPPSSENEWAAVLIEARARGEDLVQAALQEAARWGFSALPEEARQALLALQADHYGGRAGDQLRASLPWIIGGGLLLALMR